MADLNPLIRGVAGRISRDIANKSQAGSIMFDGQGMATADRAKRGATPPDYSEAGSTAKYNAGRAKFPIRNVVTPGGN